MKPPQFFVYPILLLLLMAVLSSVISFSRYSSVVSNTGDASIIVKEYELAADWADYPTAVQYPGISNQIYNFTLRNTKASDLNYTVTIRMSWGEAEPVPGLDVPLAMELYMVNEDGSLTPVATTTSRTVAAGMQIKNIHTRPAVISGQQTIDFRMKWSWGTSDAEKNYNLANKTIDIKIDVDAEQ